MIYDIKKVDHKSQLEKKLMSFLKNCSWNETKEHLLLDIKLWKHEPWESYFVAMDNDKIISMIALFKEDYYNLPEIYPYITCVFVSEEYRGQGLVKQMIDYVNAYAKTLGFERTYIPTHEIGLYEKSGYVYQKDIVNYGGGIDRLYVKEL